MSARGVIVDTSVWADHFRAAEPGLVTLLDNADVRLHPFVLGELAMGNLHQRQRTIALLGALPSAEITPQPSWLSFVASRNLGGTGIGFVDAHLLCAAMAGNHLLWTRDRRLADHAAALGCRWAE